MRSIAERNELVENNTGLVVMCVKKMNNGVYDEDLFQIGCFGLMRASELYDETLGLKFSTYAVNGIEKSLMDEIYRKRRKIRDNEISGDTLVYEDNDCVTVLDNISDDSDFSDFSEDLVDTMVQDQMIERVVSALPKRERRIFELTREGKKQWEIAEMFNISQPFVARVIKRIIKAFKDERILKKYALKKYKEDRRKINADRVREWRNKNIDHARKKQREYLRNNPEKASEWHKNYTEKNREKLNEYMRSWRNENKDREKARQREYYKNNPEKFKRWHKAYASKNREKLRNYMREWRKRKKAAVQ